MQCAPRAQYITNGITLVLPPERVDRLVAGMRGHAYASLDAHMRNAMLGHMSLNVLDPASAKYNRQQMAFVKHSVEIYKNFIRPYLPDSRMYHHNEDIRGAQKDGFSALELASLDGSRSAVSVFAVPGAREASVNIIPRGVSASACYRVTLDNSGDTFLVSGYDLLTKGVSTRIMGPMTSELILLAAAERR